MNQDIILGNSADFGTSKSGGENIDAIEHKATIGQKLFQARHDLIEPDLEKISNELCIRPHLLAALEQNDFNKFPSSCYASGFLKNYAAYLGLDVNQIVSQYKNEFQGSTKKVDLVFLEVEKKHNYAQKLTVSMVILSILVLYGVWHSTNNNKNALFSTLPDVSEVASNILISNSEAVQKRVAGILPTPNKLIPAKPTPEKPIVENNGFQLIQQAQAAPTMKNSHAAAIPSEQIRLSVRGDTWVRIVGADSEILVDRVLLAGEEFHMSNRAGMKLMTSNAGAVSLYVDGAAAGSLGKQGEIRDNISLNKQDLILKTALLIY